MSSRFSIAYIITDTHLDDNNHKDVLSVFKQFYEAAYNDDVRIVIHAGDFFTDRKKQSLKTLKLAKAIFRLARKYKLEFHLIAGNHDKTDQSVDDSYIDLYEKQGVIVHNFDFESIENNMIKIEDLYIQFLPYYTEEKYLECLNTLNAYNKENLCEANKVLITHQAVNRVINNDGSVVSNNISTSLFSDFSYVYIGHYHNRQHISDTIHYIGSSHPQNFGEDNDKGYAILYNDGDVDYCNLQFPMYHKFYIDCKDNKRIEELYKEYSNTKDFVRFIFTGDKDELLSIDENRFKSKGIDVKYESKQSRENIVMAENEEYVDFDKKKLLSTWVEYCKLNNVKKIEMSRGMKLIQKNVVS